MQNPTPGNAPCGGTLSAFLAWIWTWLTATEALESEPHSAPAPSYYVFMNRSDYRREAKPVAPALNRRIFYHLLPKDLNVGQFYERLAQISVLGRAVIYKLIQLRMRAKSYGHLSGPNYEKRRGANGRFKALARGVWEAHVLPGWHGLTPLITISTGSLLQESPRKPVRAIQTLRKSCVTSPINPAN